MQTFTPEAIYRLIKEDQETTESIRQYLDNDYRNSERVNTDLIAKWGIIEGQEVA